MKHYKEVCIIEGKLSSFIDGYIRTLKQEVLGFDDFSDEAIVYSLLEFSKFAREHDDLERITYLYDKCLEYSNKTEKFHIEYSDTYNAFLVISDEPSVF